MSSLQGDFLVWACITRSAPRTTPKTTLFGWPQSLTVASHFCRERFLLEHTLPGSSREPRGRSSSLIVGLSCPNISFPPPGLVGLAGIIWAPHFPALPSLSQSNHEWRLNCAFSSLPSASVKYTFPNVPGIGMASFLLSNTDAGFSLILYPLVIPFDWGWRAECSTPAVTSPSDAEELHSLTLKYLWKLYGL